jgi:putative DNA primase/helicase
VTQEAKERNEEEMSVAAPIEFVNPTDAIDRQQMANNVILLHRLAREAVSADRAIADSVLILSAFREGLMPINRHFAIGDVAGMIGAAIEFAIDRNVYTALALMRPARLASNGKGAESDIDSVLAFVVDGDADHGHDAPQPPVPANLTIESSFGNLQHFILLSEALPPSDAKQFARALKRATRADAADDLSHVWRLAGTSNFPNKAKIGRGRPPHPQPVRIVGEIDLTARTDVATLRAALAEHWEEEVSAPRPPQGKYDNCPVKVRALVQRMKDAGIFDKNDLEDDRDPNTVPRDWYTRMAKVLSHDLGDVEGFAIWWDCVCWHGDRPNQGIPVTEKEAKDRWKDCSKRNNGEKPLTLGTVKRMLERNFGGWTQASMYTGRDKSAAEMFAGVQVPAGMTPMGGNVTPPDAGAAAAWDKMKSTTSVRHPMITCDGATPAGTPLIGATDLLPADAQDTLALDFVSAHEHSLRFCQEWGSWLEWDGCRWQKDKTSAAFSLVRDHLRDWARGKHPMTSKPVMSAAGVAAVEKMARTDRRVVTESATWDADLMLLATPGGVVDLRTGELSPAQPGDHITKMLSVTPGGECPTWHAFLRKVLRDDDEVIAFLQRALGYSLTGLTVEDAIFFLFGPGGNGKSVFLSTVRAILGDYGDTAPIETFLESIHQGHPTDLAGLIGMRFVISNEVPIGRYWAETKVKQLTGGDRVKARFMRQDFFEFTPQLKLWVVGNNKPHLRSADDAMRRRMNVIPFLVKITEAEKDLHLRQKLAAELGGILQWMIDGCLEWQRLGGLAVPDTIKSVSKAYIDSEDRLACWIEDRCVTGGDDIRGSRDGLWQSWRGWCEQANEKAGSRNDFYEKLRTRFDEYKINTGERGFKGIKVGVVGPALPPFMSPT